MVDLSQFLPRLLPYVVGCSEPFALQALLDSAIDFCNRSGVISTELTAMNVVAGQSKYTLVTPTGTSVVNTQRVWCNGNLLDPIPYNEATDIHRTWSGSPSYYYGDFEDGVYSLTLLPTPDTSISSGLNVRVSLAPTRTATSVDTLLFDRYVDEIVAGALAILYETPNQPFTNPALVQPNMVKVSVAVATARSEVMRGNTQASMKVKMRAF